MVFFAVKPSWDPTKSIDSFLSLERVLELAANCGAKLHSRLPDLSKIHAKRIDIRLQPSQNTILAAGVEWGPILRREA